MAKTEQSGLSALLLNDDETVRANYSYGSNYPAMHAIEGKGVKEVGYANGLLYIRFAQGTLYRWQVSDWNIYEDMKDSKSPTRFFNANIKQQFRSAKFDKEVGEWIDLPYV